MSYIFPLLGTEIVLVLFYIYPIVPHAPAFISLHSFLLLVTVVKIICPKRHWYFYTLVLAFSLPYSIYAVYHDKKTLWFLSWLYFGPRLGLLFAIFLKRSVAKNLPGELAISLVPWEYKWYYEITIQRRRFMFVDKEELLFCIDKLSRRLAVLWSLASLKKLPLHRAKTPPLFQVNRVFVSSVYLFKTVFAFRGIWLLQD